MYSSAHAASPSSLSGRITGIDAARGIAMVLVFLSHIRIYLKPEAPGLYDLLTLVTRLATPSFLLLSGFVAAHVLSGPAPSHARAALIDRGLFLLLIAHLLIGVDELYAVSMTEWLFARVMVTDAIGVCLLIAVCAYALSARTLFVLAAAIIAVSWAIAVSARFDSELAQHAAAMLFHVRSHPSALVNAAIAPYLGIFLVGMGLRKSVAPLIAAGDSAALARRLLSIGGIAVACAAAGVTAWLLAKSVIEPLLSAEAEAIVQLTLHPARKLPPSPAYFVAYGGGGLIIAGFCVMGRPRFIVERVALIGRTSLLCFILQDWLTRLAPVALGFDQLSSPAFWFACFAMTVLVLYRISRRWQAIRGNRFLTVGITRIFSSRRRSWAQPTHTAPRARG